jgi:hypothetical protein
MIFSEPLLATDKTGTTLNWWEYWIGHCWMTGWQSIAGAFRIWSDLMTDNYKDYALLKEDDDAEECREWFWVSLGEDNTYPKEFLEYLMQLAADVESGKEKVIPLDEDFFDRLKDLVDGVELNDDDF